MLEGFSLKSLFQKVMPFMNSTITCWNFPDGNQVYVAMSQSRYAELIYLILTLRMGSASNSRVS